MYRNMPGGPVLIPGFCLWKALQPVLPIFLQGLTSGSAELRKQSALGLADLSIFHEVDWHRIVLDEADTIKSWRTMSARAAFTLSAHCRWCLTGTPLQNNLPDLYSLLCFLHVEPWCNWAWWNKLIQRPYENGDQRALKLIKAILRPLMLRRTKETKDKEGSRKQSAISMMPSTRNVKSRSCKGKEAKDEVEMDGFQSDDDDDESDSEMADDDEGLR